MSLPWFTVSLVLASAIQDYSVRVLCIVLLVVSSVQFGVLLFVGSKNLELVLSYLDQVFVLYGAFAGGLTLLGVLVLDSWWGGSSWSYQFNSHMKLEVLWTIVPLVFLLVMVIHSNSLLYAFDLDKCEIAGYGLVTGNQWYWSYLVSSGLVGVESRLVDSSTLLGQVPRLCLVDQPYFVRAGVAVGLVVSSGDVIHSYSLPGLGIKLDAVPGRSSNLVMSSLLKGVYVGLCSELCGSGHGFMPINVVVY
jgi:heme/copper-type cytochrome/quinol oxidase subunit 2